MEPVTTDLSLLAMFAKADPVVKGVMITLAICSLWSWATAIDKWLMFGDLNSKARQFEKNFWSGQSIEAMEDQVGDRPRDSMARVFAAAAREWRDARRGGAMAPQQIGMVQERCDRLMQAQIQREVGRANRGLGVLASIGSSSPFVGLFGTVWGIMNSFNAIATARETNLAVVAPHIAEALFATAIGLVAAIPAVVAYNRLAAALASLRADAAAAATDLAHRLARTVRAESRAQLRPAE
jgi:biopolymer transport protein TolQ